MADAPRSSIHLVWRPAVGRNANAAMEKRTSDRASRDPRQPCCAFGNWGWEASPGAGRAHPVSPGAKMPPRLAAVVLPVGLLGFVVAVGGRDFVRRLASRRSRRWPGSPACSPRRRSRSATRSRSTGSTPAASRSASSSARPRSCSTAGRRASIVGFAAPIMHLARAPAADPRRLQRVGARDRRRRRRRRRSRRSADMTPRSSSRRSLSRRSPTSASTCS